MKKLILILILAIGLTPFVLASSSLLIQPNLIDANVEIGTPQSYEITFTNKHNWTIYNISFTPLEDVTFPVIEQLTTNSSETREITILTNEAKLETLTSKVSYTYLTNATQSSQTHTVEIHEFNFQPQSITINQNDVINYWNKDTISHHIVCSEFNQNIPANGTFQYAFSTIGTIAVTDVDFGFSNIIYVNSNQEEQAVHNSDFDQTFTINLNSMFGETTLELTLLDTNFTINNGDSTQGIIKIQNTGLELASQIQITSNIDWISFSNNNFDLSPSGVKYVTFTLSPDFTIRNETDKTYIAKINTKAINSQNYSKDVSIFIPLDDTLSNIDYEQLDPSELITLLEYYIGLLNQYKINETNQQLNQSLFELNMTSEQFWNSLRLGRMSEDDKNSIITAIQNIKAQVESQATQNNNLYLLFNQTLTDNEKTRNELKNTKNIFFMFLTLIALAIIIVSTLYFKKGSSIREKWKNIYKGEEDKRKRRK